VLLYSEYPRRSIRGLLEFADTTIVLNLVYNSYLGMYETVEKYLADLLIYFPVPNRELGIIG